MDTEATTSDKTYTVLSGGENTFDISRRLGITTTELMEHNDLTSYFVAEGTTLHLPYPKDESKSEDKYNYEIWDTPRTFHIHKEGGSRKYALGNAKHWKDVKPVGGTNTRFKEVEIGGQVVITFTEKDVFGFYIDSINIKDGKVKDNIGYPMEYLTEGEAPKVETVKHPSVAEIQATLAAIEPIDAPDAEFKAEDHYIPFETGVESFVLLKNVTARDLDGLRWQKLLPIESEWTVGGTVTMENGHKFGILEKLRKQTGVYYGVPWNNETVMLATEYDRLHPEDSVIDPKEGQKYEVTSPNEVRRKFYSEDILFKPVYDQIAKAHVKVVDSFKKIKKEKV